MVSKALLAVIVCTALTAGASGAGAAAPTVPAAFRFEATPGWHTEATEPRACPGVAASRCTEAWSWTSTVPWQDCRTCTPHLTLRTLLRNGIIISVSHVRERPVAAKRQIEWPLRIRAQKVNAGMEGVPRRYGVYQLFARVRGGDEVLVWAYFGRSRPTTAQLAAANAQLRAARMR